MGVKSEDESVFFLEQPSSLGIKSDKAGKFQEVHPAREGCASQRVSHRI